MSIHDFSVKDIHGKEVRLSDFKGKTLLIVNTATKCSLTPQYDDLEELYQKYKDKGLVVLDFPSKRIWASGRRQCRNYQIFKRRISNQLSHLCQN